MTVSLDEEQWFFPTDVYPSLLQKGSPVGSISQPVSIRSSLGTTEEPAHPPQHRPVLAEPTRNPMYKIVAIQGESERLSARSIDILGQEIRCRLSEIEELSAKKEEELRKAAAAAASRDTWEVVSRISEYFLGVGAALVGASLGGVPGAILLASGLIGVGNRVLHETHFLQTAIAWFVHSEELQKQLTQKIEMVLLFLQMGLGLAGGYAAWQTGAFAAANQAGALNLMQKIVTGTGGVATAGAQLGLAYYKKQVADHETNSAEMSAEITSKHHEVSQDAAQISQLQSTIQEEIRAIQTIINRQRVSSD